VVRAQRSARRVAVTDGLEDHCARQTSASDVGCDVLDSDSACPWQAQVCVARRTCRRKSNGRPLALHLSISGNGRSTGCNHACTVPRANTLTKEALTTPAHESHRPVQSRHSHRTPVEPSLSLTLTHRPAAQLAGEAVPQQVLRLRAVGEPYVPLHTPPPPPPPVSYIRSLCPNVAGEREASNTPRP